MVPIGIGLSRRPAPDVAHQLAPRSTKDAPGATE